MLPGACARYLAARLFASMQLVAVFNQRAPCCPPATSGLPQQEAESYMAEIESVGQAYEDAQVGQRAVVVRAKADVCRRQAACAVVLE